MIGVNKDGKFSKYSTILVANFLYDLIGTGKSP